MAFINFAQRRENQFFSAVVGAVWPHTNFNCFCVPYIFFIYINIFVVNWTWWYLLLDCCCWWCLLFFSTCSLWLNSVIGLCRHNYLIYTTERHSTFEQIIKWAIFSMIWSFLMWTTTNWLVTDLIENLIFSPSLFLLLVLIRLPSSRAGWKFR